MALPLPHAVGMTRLSGILDLAHFVGFAGLAACVAWAWSLPLWLAIPGLVTLALAGETVQPLVGRTGDWRDVAYGALGVLAGLVLAYGIRARNTRFAFIPVGVVIALLAAWPMATCLPPLIDAAREYSSFPVLCDFRSSAQTERWLTQGSLKRVRLPESADGWAGQFDLLPQRNGAALAVLFPLISDWSDYRLLVLELIIEDAPLTIALQLRTGRGEHKTQLSVDSVCQPGNTQVAIDLWQMQAAHPSLELTQIHSLYLVARDLRAPRSLLVDKIFLE